ncbi:membrane protein insertase YidC [Pseudonocardia spinosispora]|uniref:membrane protein insertase YidC n=1 Tax=Pseudonocardia spinosispora TaxID=103441 RepID=UPI000414DC65|nr:membrane protein insertase YidC [Pseudonocardia spinosispora]
MLNFVYYPVSFILWCWHQVFGLVLDHNSLIAWALAIVFLVLTLRAVMLRPTIAQTRSMRRMQKIAPQVAALKTKYARDRDRQLRETQALHKEHGVNPLTGCLPMLVQIPVFIGLNHVLRNFTQYPDRPNYYFSAIDVQSYLQATVFGAHLGDALFNTGLLSAHPVTWMWSIAPLVIPLLLVSAAAMHLTARVTTAASNDNSQAAMMSTLSLWVFPIGMLAAGALLPVGLLIYVVSGNIWTLAQQRLVFAVLDREESAAGDVKAGSSATTHPRRSRRGAEATRR